LWQESPVTKESPKETVKTIAQGRPGYPGEPVVYLLVCFIYFAREAAGASAARLSLRPLFSFGRVVHSSLGRFAPRGGGGVSRFAVIARSASDEAIQLSQLRVPIMDCFASARNDDVE
jgi:hypothetical protein